MTDKVTIILVPGLEDKIRALAHQMELEHVTAEERSPVGQLLELLLPDLIDNALAGDILPAPNQELHPSDHPDYQEAIDLKAAVAEATAQVEDVDVSQPELKVENIEPLPVPEGTEEITFDSIRNEVNPKAIAWASGSPLKEAALIETVLNMPRNMWEWDKVLQLSERTFNMKGGSDDQADSGDS